jgi:hypothetical protein
MALSNMIPGKKRSIEAGEDPVWEIFSEMPETN